MDWFDRLKSDIVECDAPTVQGAVQGGAYLIDVRTQSEVAQGTALGALHMPRDTLELAVDREIPNRHTHIILMCGTGTRSILAAHGLVAMGYSKVISMRGGFDAWKARGLPTETPTAAPDPERYARHLAMPSVGTRGQSALLNAKVLVVGAGGLGSPAALYLAAAGVGTIGLVDDDHVDVTNLQRQILHSEETTGWPKVASGVARLRGLNSSIRVVPHPVRVTQTSVLGVIDDYDIVIDGTDNFDARYLLSEASRAAGKTYIYGAVFQFEGQVSVFEPTGACYRCFQPTLPPSEVAPTCAEAGVLGVLPGIIGSLQALEAIKIILKLGEPLFARLVHFDALNCRLSHIRIPIDPNCGAPHESVGKAADSW